MMSAREAAAALGGQATTATSLLCPGPGHNPRDRSLSARLHPNSPDGFTCHSFSGDDWRACRDHVRASLGIGLWRPAAAPREERSRPEPRGGDMGSWALGLWTEARDAKGTLAERYLAGHGLELDDRARESLRFHLFLSFRRGTAPPVHGGYLSGHAERQAGGALAPVIWRGMGFRDGGED